MVQLDWLRQMRHSRRQAFARSQRRDSLVSLGIAEVLEPRCVLSGVMTAMPVDDSTGTADSASQDGSTDDCSETDGSTDDATGQDTGDQTTGDTNPSDNGEPVKVMFYSLGASREDATAVSPYFSESDLRDYLLNLAQQQWGGLFGQTIPQYQYNYPWYMLEDAGGRMAFDSVSMIGAATSSRVKSDTNTQIVGVDEADFVETDGRYIYVARGGGLTILDTQNVDSTLPDDSSSFNGPLPSHWKLSTASEMELNGNVVGEFLSGDRLTVITQSGYGGWYGGPIATLRVADVYPAWGRWNPQTTVTVFDVSDRTAPSIVDQTTFDGSFRDARAVDGTVYVVLEDSFNLPEPLYTDTPVAEDDSFTVGARGGGALGIQLSLPSGQILVRGTGVPDYILNSDGSRPTIIANRTYETFDDYVARVGDQITSLSLPHAFSVDADGNTTDLGPLTSAENIVHPQSDNQQSLLTVVSIDAANASPGSGMASSTSLLTSWGSTVYMTPDALYVATTEYNYDEWSSSNDTRIDRFSVDGTNVTWQASGVVPGTLINQFAMDEQDGFLHVATHTYAQQWIPNDPTADTTDWSNGTWNTQNDNGVYVLDTVGDTLDQVGSVTGIAPGEQLFAARFIGDTAYLVTFHQVDPLFVIDLSDPTNPTVAGQLEIPGFSNYLQPVGDGQLIGLGQERVSDTEFRQLDVSLFNVTDGSSPQQVDRKYLGGDTGWGWSEAQYDHHALLYSAEDGLLVLPFASSGTDADGNWFYDQSLAVLRVDPANGLEVLGKIQTDQSVFRTVRIDNVLYAVSDGRVTAYSLDDLSQIGQADLPTASHPWYFGGLAGGVLEKSSAANGGVDSSGGSRGGVAASLTSVLAPSNASLGQISFATNTGATTGNHSDNASALPPSVTSIAMPSGPNGPGGSSTILALAAQVAQNTANDVARVGSPTIAPNTGLTPLTRDLNDSDVGDFNADWQPPRDLQEGSESRSESLQDDNTRIVDEFWEQVGERLRNGDEPMAATEESTTKADAQPMNAEKAATTKETPSTDRATEGRQAQSRPKEMSRTDRPTQPDAKSARAAKPATKTSAAKAQAQNKSARPVVVARR